MNTQTEKYYNIEEISQNYKNKYFYSDNNSNNSNKSLLLKSAIFKIKIFKNFYADYFSRTPESDSLYRRRNRLLILTASGIFYYQTASGIFNRIELEIYSKQNKNKLFCLRTLFIPFSKSIYFFTCIFMTQLFMKYIYYLNKAFKSSQFALEGLLKYEIIKKDYIYRGNHERTGRFDIVDSQNIKKNQ